MYNNHFETLHYFSYIIVLKSIFTSFVRINSLNSEIPIADLDLSEISDHWENFLDKLERNKDKKNIYSELYKVWSENLKKELKRVKKTKTYTTQSPLDDDQDLRETLIRNIY